MASRWMSSALIDALIEREGGYVNNPGRQGRADLLRDHRGGGAGATAMPGAMRQLPRERGGRDLPPALLAAAALRRDRQAQRRALAAELFDTGVNMGPAVAATFLQRALTALNRNGRDYPDLVPDGRIGATTLAALDGFLAARGKSSGETVLLRALEALQGERYLRLAERRPANEAFLYGWLANRIGER